MTTTTTPRRIRIGGIGLHVDAPVGEGEPLVIVHGGWTDHTAFDAVVEPLARSFTVIRYDRRGHSRSGRRARRRGGATRMTWPSSIDVARSRRRAPARHLVRGVHRARARDPPTRPRAQRARPRAALLGVVPDPDAQALIAGVQEQLAAGDITGGTRRFFEEGVLGPGSWERLPATLRHAAMSNAQTFIDLRDDPDWATLDLDALSRLPRPVLITTGETSPSWLHDGPRAVAAAARIATLTIAGAGHSPHLTHPDALVAVIEAFARDFSNAAHCATRVAASQQTDGP